jgi:hypothetical protein
VLFTGERIIEARSVREAIERAEAQGATEITSVSPV